MLSSRRRILLGAIVLIAITIAAALLMLALGHWITRLWGPDIAFITFLGCIVAFLFALVLAMLVYVRMTAHRSWRVNRARYPEVRAAMERYREKGEAVRPVLPAFLIDGRRYFIVKYLPKKAVWESIDESGMVVLDEQGRVQEDEALFLRLLGLVRFVEDSRDEAYLMMEEEMAAGPRLEREISKAREAFSTSALVEADGEWMPALEEFWRALSDQVQVVVSGAKGEYEWCYANRKRVEFTLEEMMPLRRALEEASAQHIENATRLTRALAKIEELRARHEGSSRSSVRLPRRLHRLLDAFEVPARIAADVEGYRMRVSPRRIEAWRTRTAKALQLEREARGSLAQ